MNALELLFILNAAQFGLPNGLLESVCSVESGLKVSAIHRQDGKGLHDSIGLCQVQLRTARQMGFTGNTKQLLLPSINTYYAAKYLSNRISVCGSVAKGVQAYSTGKCVKVGSYYMKVFNRGVK